MLTRQAQRGLSQMPPQEQRRLRTALLELATTGLGDIVKLQGRLNQWRLREGDWRAVITRVIERRQIVVLAITRRPEAYKKR